MLVRAAEELEKQGKPGEAALYDAELMKTAMKRKSQSDFEEYGGEDFRHEMYENDLEDLGNREGWEDGLYEDRQEELPPCPDCGSDNVEDDDEGYMLCKDCGAEFDKNEALAEIQDAIAMYGDYRDDDDDRSMFSDPGGHSALRASSPDNPRNLPCPTCGQPDRLTPEDRARGYQCDTCADQAEGRYGSSGKHRFIEAKKLSTEERKESPAVFSPKKKSVKPDKGRKTKEKHYPIPDLSHAQNALARVSQQDKAPAWFSGTLSELKSQVRSKVYEKYPGLKTRKQKRDKKADAQRIGLLKNAAQDIILTAEKLQASGRFVEAIAFDEVLLEILS